jgi:hypothetical protein
MTRLKPAGAPSSISNPLSAESTPDAICSSLDQVLLSDFSNFEPHLTKFAYHYLVVYAVI